MTLLTRLNKQLWYLPLLLLILFLATTNPTKLPVPFLLIPLGLLLLGSYLAVDHLLKKISLRDQSISNLIAGVISLVLVALVVLQSINQLTLRDSFLFLLLALGLAIYLSRLRR